MENQVFFPEISAFSIKASFSESSHLSSRSSACVLFPTEDARIFINKRLFLLTQGDALLLPSFTFASLLSDAPLWAYRMEFPEQICHFFAPTLLTPLAEGGGILCFSPASSSHLLDILKQILQSKERTIHPIAAFFSVLDQERLPKTESAKEISLPRVLRHALSYLSSQYTQANDAMALAERCGVSESTLFRTFRTHLSMSPNEYLKSVRAMEAARLLYSGETKQNAAKRVGFSSVDALCAALRRSYGKSFTVTRDKNK